MKRGEVFERFAPPPGGAARLRARLDAHERSARRARVAFVVVPAALAVAATVLLLVLTRPHVPDLVTAAKARGDVDEAVLGLSGTARRAPVALAAERRATAGLAAVRTEDPNVAFYWVASTE